MITPLSILLLIFTTRTRSIDENIFSSAESYPNIPVPSLLITPLPRVHQSETTSFAETGNSGPETGTWDIVAPAGVLGTFIEATDAEPRGWSVSFANGQFTVVAPENNVPHDQPRMDAAGSASGPMTRTLGSRRSLRKTHSAPSS